MRPPPVWRFSRGMLIFAVLYVVHPGIALLFGLWMMWKRR